MRGVGGEREPEIWKGGGGGRDVLTKVVLADECWL